MIQKVDNNLEVKVRRPAAIFVDVADAGELVSARNALPHLEGVKGISGEVAVKCEKFEAIARCVTKNDERAVIERRCVYCDDVDYAIKWRVDRGAGRSEHIYP